MRLDSTNFRSFNHGAVYKQTTFFYDSQDQIIRDNQKETMTSVDAHLLTRRTVNRLYCEVIYSTNPDAGVSNPEFIFRFS